MAVMHLGEGSYLTTLGAGDGRSTIREMGGEGKTWSKTDEKKAGFETLRKTGGRSSD